MAMMAYDGSHVVLFGGCCDHSNNNHNWNDTWTWDGTTWTQQSATGPSARIGGAMAYDGSHVVLFGGEDTSQNRLNDTWTWDGTTWTQQNPASSPSARLWSAMAYDSAHTQVVLFGGQSDARVNDTWAWDGMTKNWTQKSPATSPGARYLATMAYDAANGQVLLFGGSGTSSFLNDTWTWDGTNWTQRSPAPSPPVRGSATMAYDAAISQVVLFGGIANGNNILGDTWTWNVGAVNLGSAKLCLLGATTPSPCSQSATLSFDVAANTTIGSINIVTQGAAGLDFKATPSDTSTTLCQAQTYTDETVCTVDVTFAPIRAGTRYGGVVLTDGSGHVLANTYIFGTGVGPQIAFSPATQSTLFSGLQYPNNVAVDGSGNVYTSDNGNERVLKETLNGGSYTPSTIASGLGNPQGVAVDGSGNVYIADSDNNRVLMETFSGGKYTESTLPFSGLQYPNGVAVDGSGNVYIADGYNGVVVMETLSSGKYTQSTIASGLSVPGGVAVDGSGNVYIADHGNNRVLKETLSGGKYTQSTIASGLNGPIAVAVDGSGNVYIAVFGNTDLVKAMFSGGKYTLSTMASGLSGPSGVAVDGNGNVYIGDSDNSRVLKEDVVTTPSLSFGNTVFGTQSTAQTVTVTNIGNADLNFLVPASGSNPSISTTTSGVPASFAMEPQDSTIPCPQVSSSDTSPGVLGAGQSCDLPVAFTPEGVGTINGTLAFTDNILNLSSFTHSIFLSGTGTGIAPSITSIPAGETVNAGNTATFTAAASGAPTPTMQWQVNTGSGFGNIPGATSTTLSFTAAAAMNGNQYQAVFTNSIGTATAGPATLTVDTAPTITLSPLSQAVPAGSSATFKAAATGNPSPTVQWQVSVNGGAFTNIAGATSTALSFTTNDSMTGNQYRAVFTNVVSSVPTSAATLTVEDFTITPTPTSQTISAGHAATYTINLASVRGLTGNVGLTCSGGPPNSKCTVTPSSVILNGNAKTTVTLTPAMNVNHGTFTVTFTGSLLGITHSANVTLAVK
jgi:hypothetical protein